MYEYNRIYIYNVTVYKIIALHYFTNIYEKDSSWNMPGNISQDFKIETYLIGYKVVPTCV